MVWQGPVPAEDRGQKPLTGTEAPVVYLALRNTNLTPDLLEKFREIGGTRVIPDKFDLENIVMARAEVARFDNEVQRLLGFWNHMWMHHINEDDVKALVEAGRIPMRDDRMPTPEEVNLGYLLGMGHDSINAYVVCNAEAKRLGLETSCPDCGGRGYNYPSKEVEEAAEAWEPSYPEGEGYQLWNDNDRPLSPVFDSLIKLARWCAFNETTFGYDRATALQWQKMLEADFVHSTDDHGNIFL